ncbi:esterase-like activity of phytase family protein [Ruegeria pomeroyi]|uniref:esterase-like activity of phytase family protein n=1 Tax=Ruegeria pomeroyi TaxID=89184 RepID=UPI001F17129F|nr:esterase-like activity of phytase family protein [Ruegeria pomeroyi]MCE8507415.1 esterase-like activity of phytase family protein [Ruegeria pomeroyi]
MRLRLAFAIAAALVLSGPGLAVDRGEAQHLGSFTWRGTQPWFGGFSAIEMTPDGMGMTVLSDRATILTARLRRDGDQISGVEIDTVHKVRSSKNKVLKGRVGDSEGLAIGPDGVIYISFEGVARVARYTRPDGRAEVLPRPDAFRHMARNGAFEGLAMDARGRLYTLPESSRAGDGSIPVYRWDGRAWSTAFHLEQRGDFLPVAADFGPDGRLYVLERDTGAIGFRSRLRRWNVTANGVAGEETLFQSRISSHDNLEGLSVWRDGQGRLRATMVSDDNFLVLQRTELVEYLLPD